MDLNGMKSINDAYGHTAGDKLLEAVSRRMKDSLRSYDFTGRISGDEFLAVLPGISGEHLGLSVQQVKESLEQSPIDLGEGRFVRPTISVGAALYPRDGSDSGALIKFSDERMYEDKQRARMRWLSDAAAQFDPEAIAAAGQSLS